MKKLFMCILGVTLISSCSNDENELLIEQAQTKSDLMTKSIVITDTTDVLTITNDVWRQLMSSDGEFPTYENPQITIGTKAYIDARIVEGYHSCNPRSGKENLKVLHTQEACDKLGIPRSIYITDYCEVKITLYTGEGEKFIYSDYSPNCGSKPDTENSRGYSMTVNGNKIVLTTYLTHIKYDMLGMPIDKWLPVAPENLIWNYEIYIPQWN